MRAESFSPAFWARAASACFAAVSVFGFNLSARDLPDNWGWTQIWPREEVSVLPNEQTTETNFATALDAAVLAPDVYLVATTSGVFRFSDPTNPASNPELVDPHILQQIETFQGIAFGIDAEGSAWRSADGDGRVWEATGTGFFNGDLTTDANGFRFCNTVKAARSSDGFTWEQLTASLPEGMALLPSAHGRVASQRITGEGSRDQYWSMEQDGEWIQLPVEPVPSHHAVEFVRDLDLVRFTELKSSHLRGDAYVYQSETTISNLVGQSWTIPPYSPPISFSEPSPDPINVKATNYAYGRGWIAHGATLVDDSLEGFQYAFTGSLSTKYYEPLFLLIAPYGSGKAEPHIYLSDPVPPYPFSDGFLKGNGWRGSPWFGWVNTKDYPWVFHYPAGWIYTQGPDEDNCWMWDYTEGWFWTNQYYWPTIWSKERSWRVHAMMKAEG
jgi:hypothetical protein